MRIIAAVGLTVALLLPAMARAETPVWMLDYRWLDRAPFRTLADSFAPPDGFLRVIAERYSFASWLRGLPLQLDGAPIVLFDGRQRTKQSGAAAIIDIDVGTRDLQQCADAVIRLRAEYRYARGHWNTLSFAFASGDRYAFADWLKGRVPKVSGNRVSWITTEPPKYQRGNLRQWLDIVFTYAGTVSLQRELKPVADITTVQAGDVLIQGGSPGHAIIVLDVARDERNRPAVLLAQGFMPAQSIHVLRNPSGGNWFVLSPGADIMMPDWRFTAKDLRRFEGGD